MDASQVKEEGIVGEKEECQVLLSEEKDTVGGLCSFQVVVQFLAVSM